MAEDIYMYMSVVFRTGFHVLINVDHGGGGLSGVSYLDSFPGLSLPIIPVNHVFESRNVCCNSILFVIRAYCVYSILLKSYRQLYYCTHAHQSLIFYEMFCDTCMFIEHSLVPKEILHSGLIIIVPV